jgi:hypothetical protein
MIEWLCRNNVLNNVLYRAPIDIIRGSILLVHHDMSTEGNGGKLNLEVDLK